MKSLFASKTFWFNLLAGAVQIGGLVPSKYGVPITMIANIGLRLVTTQPVSVLPQPE